ncbi:DUF1648 domain-containing protein [Loigolactobacillus zhaoyuanensis]|uniref:DUF1648 domain-containing protein n=1 Tax=Loigolactobacillus zhaoyuanensis TaxID=2486017 RepID=A0ABW8UJ38_9LACO
MTQHKKLSLLIGSNTVVQCLLLIIFQHTLPEHIPSHFNFLGQADSYAFVSNPLSAALVVILLLNFAVFFLNFANFFIPYVLPTLSLAIALTAWVIVLQLITHAAWLTLIQFGANIFYEKN